MWTGDLNTPGTAGHCEASREDVRLGDIMETIVIQALRALVSQALRVSEFSNADDALPPVAGVASVYASEGVGRFPDTISQSPSSSRTPSIVRF